MLHFPDNDPESCISSNILGSIFKCRTKDGGTPSCSGLGSATGTGATAAPHSNGCVGYSAPLHLRARRLQLSGLARAGAHLRTGSTVECVCSAVCRKAVAYRGKRLGEDFVLEHGCGWSATVAPHGQRNLSVIPIMRRSLSRHENSTAG